MDTNNTGQPGEVKQTFTEEKDKEIHHHHYYYRNPKHGAVNFGQLFFGLLLVFFGIAYLAKTMGLADISFGFSLPMVIAILVIVAGLSMITFRGWLGGIIGLILILLLTGVIIFMTLTPVNFRQFGLYQMMNPGGQTEQILIEKDARADKGELNIETGALSFNITGPTEQFIAGTFSSPYMTMEKTSAVNGKIQNATLKTSGTWNMMMGDSENKLDIELNPYLPMAVVIKSGASDMNLDLREIKVEKMTLDIGATSLKMHVGDKLETSVFNIKAGASSIKIWLPSYLGAKVNIRSALTNKDFKDFNKKDEQTYISKNYDIAQKKIEIDLDAGASSVVIDWE